MSKRWAKFGDWLVAGLASVSLLSSGIAEAADHRDSPRLMANIAFEGNADINDVYIFQSPTTKTNSVIIVTLSPAAGVVGPGTFHSLVSYEVRVQNTAALADNMVFQFTFSEPDAYGRQSMQLVKQTAKGGPLATPTSVAPLNTIQNEVLAFGTTGKPLAVKGGGTVMAGLFDDPFFFDLNAFNAFVTLAQENATLAERVAPFLPPSIPNDFFGNFNVIAVVMEVPTTSLLSSKSNPKLGIWARTVNGEDQIDRMGRPAINTAAIPKAYKNAFNAFTPFTDGLFTGPMVEDITQLYGVSTTYAQGLAGVLLPDLLTIDTSMPSGFLNGRKLTDDVIDAEFKLLTKGALTTDRVDNDSVFFNTFPYLGTAQPKVPLQ